jgi:hypothetical protein
MTIRVATRRSRAGHAPAPLDRVALLDLALLAVPTGILGSGFVEEFQSRCEPEHCPHCGEQIKQPRLYSVAGGGAGGKRA